RLLRRFSRVFCISPGLQEHLLDKYQIPSTWLPMPAELTRTTYMAYEPTTPDVRAVTYLGAINPLYISSLRDCQDAIVRWNASPRPFKMRLEVLTYTDPTYVRAQLTAAETDFHLGLPANEVIQRLRR